MYHLKKLQTDSDGTWWIGWEDHLDKLMSLVKIQKVKGDITWKSLCNNVNVFPAVHFK